VIPIHRLPHAAFTLGDVKLGGGDVLGSPIADKATPDIHTEQNPTPSIVLWARYKWRHLSICFTSNTFEFSDL
jgi:hypothetical protein